MMKIGFPNQIEWLRLVMEKHKPYILIMIIQLIYTGLSIFSKAAISKGMKPSIFVAYRQAFATLALAPFAFFFGSSRNARLTLKLLFQIFLASFFGLTVSLNLFYTGINYTSATFATAITNTIPAIVFVMAVCFKLESVAIREWHGVAKVVGCAVGLSGAMVFTFYKGPALHGKDNPHDPSGRVYTREDWIKGSLLMLGATISFSLWLIMQVPILKEYPAKLRLTTMQCCFSCVTSTVWSAIVERQISSWKLSWDLNLLSVAYCGIVVTGIAYWLQNWVIELKGPVFPAMFSPMSLVLTAIFSSIFFKETLHCGSVLGCLLLVVGLYSFLWGKSKESKNQENVKQPDEAEDETASGCIIFTSSSDNKHQQEKNEGEKFNAEV